MRERTYICCDLSRFSRSTLGSIQYTQELLEHDVGVLFQNDNIIP